MSYFNSDQLDYMASLNQIPADEKCWCGWYRLGQCYNCNNAGITASAEERGEHTCPDCGNYPSKPELKTTHLINCPRRP